MGDTVRLRSFGSIGIVDSMKGDEAEVRVKSLRLRERLENLERVEPAVASPAKKGKFASLQKSRATEVQLKPEPETR